LLSGDARGSNSDHLGELGLLDTPEAAARLAFPQLDSSSQAYPVRQATDASTAPGAGKASARDQKHAGDTEDAQCAGAQEERNQLTGCGVYFALDSVGRPVSFCVCTSVSASASRSRHDLCVVRIIFFVTWTSALSCRWLMLCLREAAPPPGMSSIAELAVEIRDKYVGEIDLSRSTIHHALLCAR
jgi:hypothetical protein